MPKHKPTQPAYPHEIDGVGVVHPLDPHGTGTAPPCPQTTPCPQDEPTPTHTSNTHAPFTERGQKSEAQNTEKHQED